MTNKEKRCDSYNKLINDIKDYSEEEKLIRVNNFFNQIFYIKDSEQYKVKDYWASREETINSGMADCEDYVIAKFHTLLDLGVDEEKLYLCYCILKGQEHHTVLLYYDKENSYPIVLDNYNKRMVCLPDREDMSPVYAFNTSRAFIQKNKKGKELNVEKINNVKKLRNLIK